MGLSAFRAWLQQAAGSRALSQSVHGSKLLKPAISLQELHQAKYYSGAWFHVSAVYDHLLLYMRAAEPSLALTSHSTSMNMVAGRL